MKLQLSLLFNNQPLLFSLVIIGKPQAELSKGRAAAVNRRKLLQRPLGLRALDKSRRLSSAGTYGSTYSAALA